MVFVLYSLTVFDFVRVAAGRCTVALVSTPPQPRPAIRCNSRVHSCSSHDQHHCSLKLILAPLNNANVLIGKIQHAPDLLKMSSFCINLGLQDLDVSDVGHGQECGANEVCSCKMMLNRFFLKEAAGVL